MSFFHFLTTSIGSNTVSIVGMINDENDAMSGFDSEDAVVVSLLSLWSTESAGFWAESDAEKFWFFL